MLVIDLLATVCSVAWAVLIFEHDHVAQHRLLPFEVALSSLPRHGEGTGGWVANSQEHEVVRAHRPTPPRCVSGIGPPTLVICLL